MRSLEIDNCLKQATTSNISVVETLRHSEFNQDEKGTIKSAAQRYFATKFPAAQRQNHRQIERTQKKNNNTNKCVRFFLSFIEYAEEWYW